MGQGKGIREVGFFDCAGGGQVVVRNGIAYIGNMSAPDGTVIVDVRDPKHPKELARLGMFVGTHSHKVRVGNDLMVINREVNHYQPGASKDFKGGLGIYDISAPGKPRLITQWETKGQGVHRFDFDGRYVYFSPTVEGYVGNIMMILDLADPARPLEVGRWWMPGQWTAGGETPSWRGTQHRCHHPLRMGNRLYTSYWHGGFVILDIDDMTKPKFVSGLDWSPPFAHPTHSAVPVPFEVRGRKIILVADEDVAKTHPEAPAFLWIVDVTDETKPIPLSTFQMDDYDQTPQPEYSGCHQPVEAITSTEVPVAWFAKGLRIIDIANPHSPKEVAWYLPDVPQGAQRVCSNDVFVDQRGLIYLLDRIRGLSVVERVA